MPARARDRRRSSTSACPCSASSPKWREVVQRYGCDAVAVTSDDSTRYNYLRELAWSLEGTGVEMLVDPGLVEVAGPRMHIRPLMGLPAAAHRGAALQRLARGDQARQPTSS